MRTPANARAGAAGIHKIKHIVIIMQENRSFDSYFGTYLAAKYAGQRQTVDGIPGLAGHPGKVPCIPDPQRHDCQKPYHNTLDVNAGGPHMAVDCTDGHQRRQDERLHPQRRIGPPGHRPVRVPRRRSYTTAEAAERPERPAVPRRDGLPHRARARATTGSTRSNFVLQDHMFSPVASWSLPAHLYMMSAWSALCTSPTNPMSCKTNLVNPDADGANRQRPQTRCCSARAR